MDKRGEWPHSDPIRQGFPIEGADVKSCRRTLEVFEFFAEMQRPMTVMEVSGFLKYPPSSTASLLKTLMSLGYLEYQIVSHTYRPTVRAILIGDQLRETYFGRLSVLDLMRRIAKHTSFDVCIAIQSGLFVQPLMMISGTDERNVSARTGKLWPICRTAFGIALLSSKTDSQVSGLLRAANLSEEALYRVKEQDILAEVHVARRRGVAACYGRFRPDFGAIATLLPVTITGTPMAIGIVGSAKNAKEAESPLAGYLLRQVNLAERLSLDAVAEKTGQKLTAEAHQMQSAP